MNLDIMFYFYILPFLAPAFYELMNLVDDNKTYTKMPESLF